jgi:2-polyprenyl-3-methyl-5-hydroxy-6-metoxy-1,4-benzoquinol methylase
MKNYLDINKDAWNKRTRIHIKSAFYNLENWIKGECSLNSIELNLLEQVKNKRILHLQCHFGQDTLSLSRLGAKCTGVDFSTEAINKANYFCPFINVG